MIDEIGNLLCASQSSRRDFLNQLDEFVFLQPLVHLGVDGTAGYGIYLNVAWGQFFGKGLSERVDAALGRRLGHLTGSAPQSPHGGNVDDPSASV